VNLADRIEKYVPLLPAELKQLLDAELAAGNEIIDVEFGIAEDQEKIAVVVNHPFRIKSPTTPPGITYRELLDHDPMIFEFRTPEERFSLLTLKFKPMVFDQLFPGPISPNEAEIAEQNRQVETEAAQRTARPPDVPPPPPPLLLADAGTKFIDSMNITFEMWHDGDGYDLETLKKVSPSERDAIENILINHQPRDWRDIEALAQIDSPKARAAVEAALKSSDAKVRREAMLHAEEAADPKDREKHLIQALRSAGLYNGLSEAIDEAAEFHPPAVIETLFHGALDRDGEAAVHFAALLFFLHGKSAEPFDWNHRPFFLRFNTTDRNERTVVFRELCQILGIDVTKYLRS
jgi:hypothetical protein